MWLDCDFYFELVTGFLMIMNSCLVAGKTQLINHFLVNKSWYIVDLPGYG